MFVPPKQLIFASGILNIVPFHGLSDSLEKRGVEFPLLDAIIALKIQMERA